MQYHYIRKDGHRIGAIAITEKNGRVYIGGAMITPEDRKASHKFDPKVTAGLAVSRAAAKSWKHKSSNSTSFTLGTVNTEEALVQKVSKLNIPFNKWNLSISSVVSQIWPTVSSDGFVSV